MLAVVSKKCPSRALVALLSLSMASWTAHAQPAKAQADLLFRRGMELRDAGKLAEACAAFDASQRIDPATETVLNQAHCRELNGQLATAWALFLDAARQTRSPARKADQQMHATATERAARLEARLSTLRIAVPPASRIAGLEVMRDGDVLEPATWNKPVPIDGGTYRLTARAPGRAEWSSTVTVATERDARSVEIPVLRAAEPAPVDAAPIARATPGAALSSVPRATWSTRRKLAVGFAGGGALALAAGSALGVVAKQRQADAHALCPDPQLACDRADRANELSRSGHNLASGANAAFGVAAAATAAAVILWVTGTPESHPALAVVPIASPGQIAVTASGSF